MCAGCRGSTAVEFFVHVFSAGDVRRGRDRSAGPGPVRGVPRRAPRSAQWLPGRADRGTGAPIVGALADHVAGSGEARNLRREGLGSTKPSPAAHVPRSASPRRQTTTTSSMTTTPSPQSSEPTARHANHHGARPHRSGWTTRSTATGAARYRCAGCTCTCCANLHSTAGTQTSCASS